MICPHCGSAILIDANFCPRCGTNLREEDAQRRTPTQPVDTSIPASKTATSTTPVASNENTTANAPETEETQPSLSQTSTSTSPGVDLRALTAISGLLDPVRIGGDWNEEAPIPLPEPSVLTASPDALRQIRQQMLGEATLIQMLPTFSITDTSHRVRWIFVLLALAVFVPVFLGWTDAAPASSEANISNALVQTIDQLSFDSDVFVFWAYDAATAGEMDGIALPVVRQLLSRNARSTVVTLLPGGIPTARRLYQQAVRDNPVDADTSELGLQRVLNEIRFLPGGATALPSLGPCIGEDCPYELVVIVAAQAEDVQQWLELVQPTFERPVLALTSAAVGPIVRPYLETQQLTGLLSGFDGAARYADEQGKLLLTRPESAAQQRHLAGQSWGTLALLVILLLANLLASGNMREAE